jgi:hypothetical protein
MPIWMVGSASGTGTQLATPVVLEVSTLPAPGMPLIILIWPPILMESDIFTPPITSNLAPGVVVPIPTFWAMPVKVKNNKTEIANTLYIIYSLLHFKEIQLVNENSFSNGR